MSAVVVWEVRIKEAIGKIRLPSNFWHVLKDQEFVEFPVATDHAYTVGALPPLHRDPFDRQLVCQAICEKLTIVTRDKGIPKYGISTLGA